MNDEYQAARAFSFIISHSSFIIFLQPLAAVDDLCLSGEDDFAVVAPEDFERAAGHVDAYAPVCAFADHRGDGGGARARPRRERLARAALPDARLDVLAV